VKKLKEEQLLTLVGMRILQQEFSTHAKEWKFLMHKGKIFLKGSLGINDEALNKLLSSVAYGFI